MTEHFTCALCRETFTKKRSDDEAMAELKDNFGDTDLGPLVVLCDGCYELVYRRHMQTQH